MKHQRKDHTTNVWGIRYRILLEQSLPAGVPPTPSNMLLYYGANMLHSGGSR